jgi:N-acetylmuramoyl-L-alanine amidase
MIDEITMSPGHGLYVRGANKFLDEVNEARKVVARVGAYLRELGIKLHTYQDDTTKSQNANLKAIVDHHNATSRDLDISVHFNAGGGTGVEVLYYDEKAKASSLSKAIADALGLPDRGAKPRKELYFLRKTNKPALLIEVCFVDRTEDKVAYEKNFDKMCRAIAENLSGKKLSGSTTDKPVAESAPSVKPSDDKKYRLRTGLFETADDLANAIERMNKDFKWLTYEKPENAGYDPGYRIVTGFFTGKNVAEASADKLRKKYGWTVYVDEA